MKVSLCSEQQNLTISKCLCNTNSGSNRASFLDILRRGMKEAISAEVDLVILDMDTQGELGVTLEIMQEILDSVESWKGTILTM